MYSFNRGYGLSNDQAYLSSEASSVDVMLDKPIESSGASIREVGASANPFEHQTTALLARIKEGASRVEFSFMGAGKGNKQSFTPESFGSVERREMRDLARLNEVETSTHASPNTGPLSGFGQQGFDEQQRANVIKEINKAIDFAGDATTGGAVVFHIGEWQRPIENNYGMKNDGNRFRAFGADKIIDTKENNFLTPEQAKKIDPSEIGINKRYKYHSESDKAKLLLADEKTGQVQALSRDMDFFVPELDDELTKESLKLGGPPIFKVEEHGTKKGEVKIKRKSFKEVLEEYEKRAKNGESDLVFNKDGTRKSAEEIVFHAYLNKEIEQATGDSLRWAMRVPEMKKEYKNINNKADYQRSLFMEEKERRMRENEELSRRDPNYKKLSDEKIREMAYGAALQKSDAHHALIDLNGNIDIKSIENAKKELIAQIHSDQSTGSGQKQRAMQLEEQLKNTKKIETVGISKTADTISDVAIKAINVTRKNKDKLKNDIYVAPESYDPTLFGGHPDEIRKIIKESRAKLVEKLTRNNHYKKEEAEKLAVKHIRGTLDIGHLNMWRQFMVKKDNETKEQFDKRFNKWILDETEKLAKENLIGHAHLSDNFGYDDEHLVAGEGNAPVAEFMKRMKKHGVNEFIQEPGSFNFEYALRQTWRNMGVGNFPASGVYRASSDRALPGRVDQFMNSYFGHTAKPSYVFGKYFPAVPNAEKSWAPWTGTPL